MPVLRKKILCKLVVSYVSSLKVTREEEGEEEKEKERENEGEGDNSTFTAIAIEAANRTLLGSAGEHRMQARVKPP